MVNSPTPVAMATKFETKLAITLLVYEISPRYLSLTGGFGGQAIWRYRLNFKTTDPRYHGNEIWDKIDHNSTSMWDISEILASNGVFGVKLSNNVNQILRRPTLVAMATKLNKFVVFTRDSIICYSAYMLSPVRPSVCPSVTRMDHTKTVEVRIMKFTPYGSPTLLVSREQVSSQNSGGSPERGR